MPNKKNTSDTYDKLKTAVTLIGDDLQKDLPQFTETDFLGIFGTKFQDQLSDSGRNILQRLLAEDILNSEPTIINEQFQKDCQETENTFTANFLASLDSDTSIKKAQEELQKKLATTKEQLFKDFINKLNGQRHRFSPEDEIKIKTTFIKYLNKNYTELNNRLENFKKIPAIYAKYQSHQEVEKVQTKANKNVSHLITRDLALEELHPKPKPEPTFGFKVDKKNLSEQIQCDIAAEKNIDINLTVPDQSTIFKRIADTGFQHRKPDLAIVYMLIFFFVMYIYNNEKRSIQSIKDVIKEKQLFDLDPSKITLQMTIPTPNGNEKVIRKKGPLNPEQIKELQSMIDENKSQLLKHHHSTQTIKKSGLTPTESGYNTEEEIPYSRPRP